MSRTVSVIIPVYNTENYLKECIDSVLKQSYTDLQIILIDDGSTDDSGRICDEYAKIDDRIFVIHQKNRGAAGAKNAGLKVAAGEYLTFLDSDDYLETNAYSVMVEHLKKYRADVVQCSFKNVYKNRIENNTSFSNFKEFSCTAYLALFTKDWTCGLLWDKMYRRKLFEGIYFEEGHKIDDEFFTYQGVMNAEKIVRVPCVTYNYRKRLSGVMLSETSQAKILLDKLEYLSIRRKFVAAQFPSLKRSFDEQYLNMLVILSKDPHITEEGMYKIKQLLRDYDAEPERIHIEFGLRRRLLHLRLRSVSKLIDEKQKYMTERDTGLYYE